MKKAELIGELAKYPDDAEVQIEIPYDVGDGPRVSNTGIGGIRFEVSAGVEGFTDPMITLVPE
jgi:hypothetical protein